MSEPLYRCPIGNKNTSFVGSINQKWDVWCVVYNGVYGCPVAYPIIVVFDGNAWASAFLKDLREGRFPMLAIPSTWQKAIAMYEKWIEPDPSISPNASAR